MHKIVKYILCWHHKQFSFFLQHFHMRQATYPIEVFPIFLTNHILNFSQNDASFCMPFFEVSPDTKVHRVEVQKAWRPHTI